MHQLYAIGNNINQIVRKTNLLGVVDVKALEEQMNKLDRFEDEMEVTVMENMK